MEWCHHYCLLQIARQDQSGIATWQRPIVWLHAFPCRINVMCDSDVHGHGYLASLHVLARVMESLSFWVLPRHLLHSYMLL